MEVLIINLYYYYYYYYYYLLLLSLIINIDIIIIIIIIIITIIIKTGMFLEDPGISLSIVTWYHLTRTVAYRAIATQKNK